MEILKKLTNAVDTITDQQEYHGVLNLRVMQICIVTLLVLVCMMLVANGITAVIFLLGIGFVLISFVFAYSGRQNGAVSTLIWSMAIMISMLAVIGAGIFDLAMVGYPGVLIMAAILGRLKLFISLLVFIFVQNVVIVWLTLNNYLTPNIPTISWPYLIFTLGIFSITAFTIYVMTSDIKALLSSLYTENKKAKESKEQLEYLAYHDRLTKLPNRQYAEMRFPQLLNACTQNKKYIAVLFIDLDNFKPVNDALGHDAGDELLAKLALRLCSVLPENHELIRFGGDEFILLVPHCNDPKELGILANFIIDQVTASFDIMQHQVSVSASVGIACTPYNGDNFVQLCRKADIAMNRSKESGRNSYYYYDEGLAQDRLDQFEMLQRLRQAVNKKEFELYYQPIVNIQTKQVVSVEALIRWPQADGSVIGPDQFIPLAENSGLINALGSWVIHEACKHCALWRKQGYTSFSVAVNLSVVQFLDNKLVKTVSEALEEFGLFGDALVLEITESLLMGKTTMIQEQLKALNKLGATIAIDDFGTGYSNLSYLRNMHAKTLKIDRSFISSPQQWQANMPVVTAIIQMANSLGLKIVAEGIENEDIAKHLNALGCDKGQGYLWSAPVPFEQLQALLTKECTSA